MKPGIPPGRPHIIRLTEHMLGGKYQVGKHAWTTMLSGISASHPLLVVVVYSELPVKLTTAPTVE
jgi:hypothetical protein